MMPTGAAWPSEQAGEALAALARHLGWSRTQPSAGRTAVTVDATAGALELDVAPVDCAAGALAETLCAAAPALVALPDGGVLAVVRGRGGRLWVLTPALRLRSIPVGPLADGLREPLEAPHRAAVERLLDDAQIPSGRRARVRRSLLADRIAAERIGGVRPLRPAAHTSLRWQLRAAGLLPRSLRWMATHVAWATVFTFSWWLLAQALLADRVDAGFFAGWALSLLTTIPLRAAATRMGGRLGLEVGLILQRRLLAGVVALDADEARLAGAGHHLGVVLEAEALSSQGLAGALDLALAAVELGVAGVVLGLGGGLLPVLLLLCWLGVAGGAGAALVRARHRWTRGRLDLTTRTVEVMVGQRTRIAQQPPSQWHDGEDRDLSAAFDDGATVDTWDRRLVVGLPNGFMLLGLVGLLPALWAGEASSGELAVGLGGTLLATRAFGRVAQGVRAAAAALSAWPRVRPLLAEIERADTSGTAPQATDAPPAPPMPLQASDLTYTHPRSTQPVLDRVAVRLVPGDRWLLGGESGAGKSTLASILAGQRDAQAGVVLLGGLDRHVLGREAWRRRVILVPQFHENHVFLGPLSFNLLMGRRWPPTPADLADAQATIAALGLDAVVDRMPAGLEQMVGETGWQLSHGERSRVYLARALLQGGDVLLLDESVGALDAATAARCLEAVDRHPGAVVLIAHP